MNGADETLSKSISRNGVIGYHGCKEARLVRPNGTHVFFVFRPSPPQWRSKCPTTSFVHREGAPAEVDPDGEMTWWSEGEISKVVGP